MNVDDCIRVLETYLRGSADPDGYGVRPRIVIVEHPAQVQRIVQHFRSSRSLTFKTAADYARNGVFDKATFYDETQRERTGKFILTGITTCGCLVGKQEVKSLLQHVCGLSRDEHYRMVFICLNIMDIAESLTPRHLPFVMRVQEGMEYSWPRVQLLPSAYPTPGDAPCVDSLAALPAYLETHWEIRRFYVRTDLSRQPFLDGLIEMAESGSEYEILCKMDDMTRRLSESLGENSQWREALAKMAEGGNWGRLFEKEFHASPQDAEKLIARYAEFSPFARWLCLLALKLYGGTNHPMVAQAAHASGCMEEFFEHLWLDVLEQDWRAADYWDYYRERKSLLSRMPEAANRADKLVSMVWSKQEGALYYLTDLTETEQLALFRYFEQYAKMFTAEELRHALNHIHPALAAYLSPVDFSTAMTCNDAAAGDYLAHYFSHYRLCKLMNRVDAEALSLVEEQSHEHRFLTWLKPREAVLRDLRMIPQQRTIVMFIDALGVEFLGYISALCREMGLLSSVSVARAMVPTITECNKGFLAALEQRGCKVLSNLQLDKIKHEGRERFASDGLPTYLLQELEELKQCIHEAKRLLRDPHEPAAQVVLVSDHGASRLAVLHGEEKRLECDVKATHGGRMVSGEADVSALGDQVVKSDDEQYYSIASYDLIRGGRKASVETHGGATLEEICVPVITLTCPAAPVQVKVLNQPVKFSRVRRNAELSLYITPNLMTGVYVRLDGTGERIAATSEDGLNYRVALKDLTASGIHHVTVYADNAVLAENVEFNAVSDLGKKNTLFP